MKITNRFFIVKIRVPTNFMCLREKVPSEICQKVVSLSLRTALKLLIVNLDFGDMPESGDIRFHNNLYKNVISVNF